MNKSGYQKLHRYYLTLRAGVVPDQQANRNTDTQRRDSAGAPCAPLTHSTITLLYSWGLRGAGFHLLALRKARDLRQFTTEGVMRDYGRN